MKAEKIISARHSEKRDSIQIEYACYLLRIGQLFTNDMKNELSFTRILSREVSLKLAWTLQNNFDDHFFNLPWIILYYALLFR